MRGEFEFIEKLRQRNRRRVRDLRVGIGDDAAVFRFSDRNANTVITTDLLVEDIDFRREWLLRKELARFLGHKALAVSLSDIAAMGARPRFALTSIGVPKNIWRTKFLDDFYESFFALADKFNVALIGGDISRTTEKIIIDSIVIGSLRQPFEIGRLRSGAQVGDLIFVTGALGGASAGLKLLESGKRRRIADCGLRIADFENHNPKIENRKSLILRQLYPTPRLDVSLQVPSNSMIDLSDGLSSDLAHICRESKVGALIYADKIPLDPALEKIGISKRDALMLALNGGEDFELLFTCRPSTAEKVPARIGDIPITHIGEITNDVGQIVLMNNGRARRLKPSGFAHFR